MAGDHVAASMTTGAARLRSTATLLAFIGAVAPADAVVGPSVQGSRIGESVVMLLTRDEGTAGFCTAIVLSPTAVMTAAHCVPPGADLRVHFPVPAGADPVLLPVGGVARHPGYRPDAIRKRERSIDLALVRLARPLPARFVPATIAAAGGAALGRPFTVSGYGVSREGVGASSGQLRSVPLSARAPLSDVLLWAEDPNHAGAGACTGDSGAPVTAGDEPAVTAMVVWSAGAGTRQCGDLTQALWLAPQRGWIDGVLQRWRSGG